MIAESAAADVGVDKRLVRSVVALRTRGRGHGPGLRGYAKRHGVRDARVCRDADSIQCLPVYVSQRDPGPVHIGATTADTHTSAPGAPLRLSQSSRFQPTRRPLRLKRFGESLSYIPYMYYSKKSISLYVHLIVRFCSLT